MSSRREDDSRPPGANSQRHTARAVPAAKFKEGSVGTIAPRGLRGPSLLPGQGAPDRLVPEEVELAVLLREAETLDGVQVARLAVERETDPRSPSPTPVSVEVPRVRSSYAVLDESWSTPPSPSARSIQSGTLLSLGSVDPRAPTELSLPTPRALSVSERAAYFGPEAVVDRTPVRVARELPGVVESSRYEVGERSTTPHPEAPYSEPAPYSSSRSAPSSSGAASSTRPSLRAESVAPAAQHFARAPRSYSPVLPESGSPVQASLRMPSVSAGDRHVDPEFQIHANLDAVANAVQDDAFDLRSTSTQREPLASRKALAYPDWAADGLPSERQRRTPSVVGVTGRHSSSAVTISVSDLRDGAAPSGPAVTVQRATVPLTWVLAAATFALLLALIVAWTLRPTLAQDTASPAVVRPPLAASAALRFGAPGAPPAAAPHESEAHAGVPAATPGVPRLTNAPQKAAPVRTTISAASATVAPVPDAQAPGDASSKAHQSIY